MITSHQRDMITVPTISRTGEILATLRRGPLLMVLYGEELGKRYHLDGDDLVVGRSLGAQIVLDNPSVSRQHFRVVRDERETYIEDVGSTNGTFVNGVRLEARSVLQVGDLISAGNVILKYLPFEESDRFFSRELFRLSTVDPLTDAYNKQFFMGILSKEVDRSVRYGHPLSLMLLDVDGFEAVNAEHGRQAGDAAMCGLSRLVMEAIRKQDVCARYDDDTFAVLLPETESERALQVAERLRRNVEAHPFRLDEERTFQLAVSVGVTTLDEEAKTVSVLLKRVDDALHRAKKAGANRVSI